MPVNLHKSLPKTLKEAIDTIVYDLDQKERTYLSSPEPMTHFDFGMNMRNSWGLWTDSVLAQHFKKEYGLGHADDMSGLILSGVIAKVKGEPFDIPKEVQFYKDHWEAQGIDPLTQRRIK